MPSVGTQFHMLFDELISFVADVRARYSLNAELEKWFPTTTHEVPSSADLTEEVRRFGHVDRIWLLWKPPRCRKYERFMLNVGRKKGDRLQQAFLGAGTDKPVAFTVLKKVAQDLKKRTTAGLWVISQTGHVGYSKTCRISPGAASAARAGEIELADMAFGASYRVDPPE